MKEALLYKKLSNKKVRCGVCNHRCVVPENGLGFCRVRKNEGGKFFSTVYGKPCSLAVDPIEKKPLFHFLPGTDAFSVATVGCNLRCKMCQNWRISQACLEDIPYRNASPEQVVNLASKSGCASIAFTYTEPTVFFEYANDIAKAAKKRKIKSVFVTNGFMTKETLGLAVMDAANVDLKGSDNFYKKVCAASLEPVLKNIRAMKKKGVHVEVTNLLVPGENDNKSDLKHLAEFICSVDKNIPLHFSAFHPDYLMTDKARTPRETLVKARSIALDAGVRYAYCGNTFPGDPFENSYCYNCGALLVKRHGFEVADIALKKNKCPACGKKQNFVVM